MDTHRNLLAQVWQLYERHGQSARSRKPFNIFTTLRKSSDEVNLHSRFLHALLDQQESEHNRRSNLEDFLANVAHIKCFPVDGANVHREFHNIDLLIENVQQKRAVVIENKIWARDQERQLQNYNETLLERGYPQDGIDHVYLTPFGDSPSEQSVGDLNCKEVSYRDDLPPWLERCKKRAFDDPALRESINQYLDLVRKLTDTDRSAEYMADLRKLCLEGSNLIRAHELSKALVEAKSELVCDLGKAIHDELEKIEGFPSQDDKGLIEYDNVRKCLTRKTGQYLGLSYKINERAKFIVGAGNDSLWYGVSCEKADFPEFNAKLRECLHKVLRGHDDADDEPWYRYVEIDDEGGQLDIRELNPECLSQLQSEKRCRELAATISTQLAELWHEIKNSVLHGSGE